MHPHIITKANDAGFSESAGTLLILPYGAEDTLSIISALDGRRESVDTVISILTLCTVPEPELTLHRLVHDILKPGGQFLFYEHILSPRADVAWWQRVWSPIWGLFMDGCRLDRPTHVWVQKMGVGVGDDGVWKEGRVWDKGDDSEENLFYHKIGKFIKKVI
jgi:hypothetical protein